MTDEERNRWGRVKRQDWGLRIRPELVRRVQRAAERHQVSRNIIVEHALEYYLEHIEDDSDRLDDEILRERTP